MAVYAIGDVQGMYDELMALLAKIGFDPAIDTLWFTGDLVNRGPDSVGALRYIKGLGSSAITVLGNHDLHLLAVAEGAAKPGEGHTLDQVLDAPDKGELLEWLRHRPLLHVEGEHVLVHAGLLAPWSITNALELAGEVESILRGEGYRELLMKMYGDTPDSWSDELSGHERRRVVINAMTRIRVVSPDGKMLISFTGRPEEIPEGYMHWADAPMRKSADHTIVYGHWAAQGLNLDRPDALALDSGCLWGGSLSALRLDDRAIFQVPCGRRI